MNKTIEVLAARAKAFQKIRQHFVENHAIEVDTPLLAAYSVTDPYMSALAVSSPNQARAGYLQTSPEYAMKKLLAQGSGDIFQLGKVFRAEEFGPRHRSEFSMLEWYRVGWHEQQLMDEVFELVNLITGPKQRINMSYRQAFIDYLGIDPFAISESELAKLTKEKVGEIPENMLFDNYLTLLFSTQIEIRFDKDIVTFVYDFPASQASLAQTSNTDYGEVAKRFEVYSGGLELANGFNELTDWKIQLERFQKDNQTRNQLGYPEVEIDMTFIDALKIGMPQCSGVALGVDRLLMLKFGVEDIQQVLPW